MKFDDFLKQTGEFGIVEQIRYPIVLVSGLPNASPNELVLFENGEIGQLTTLGENLAEVLIFSKSPVAIGTKVARTNQSLTVQVGEGLLGKVIDPLGKGLIDHNISKTTQTRPIYSAPLSIKERIRIKKPFLTGTTLVDMLLPLGKGQREMVVGDRKVGKTAFLLTTIKSQIQEGVVVVYAAIGKKRSEVKKIVNFLGEQKLMPNVVVVASFSDQSPALISLTPYSAQTIAEYFKDLGRDVLVVFDDLSTHARFYREISLIGKKFPGRESYPGDTFYAHAKLLERAGNFKHPQKGEVSITALPVAEAVEGDLTSYIVSNLISITDGHLLFDNLIFSGGRRPAVDISLSVTRVGKQTRGELLRSLNTKLLAFLSHYEKIQNVSQFGAELSQDTKLALQRAQKLYILLEQHYQQIIPQALQVVLVMLVWLGFLDVLPEEQVGKARDEALKSYTANSQARASVEAILKSTDLDQAMEELEKSKEGLLTLLGIKSLFPVIQPPPLQQPLPPNAAASQIVPVAQKQPGKDEPAIDGTPILPSEDGKTDLGVKV